MPTNLHVVEPVRIFCLRGVLPGPDAEPPHPPGGRELDLDPGEGAQGRVVDGGAAPVQHVARRHARVGVPRRGGPLAPAPGEAAGAGRPLV